MACACILQFYRALSDREVEEACMFDIQIKYALGLGIDERPFDHSSLGDFRQRLLDNGREKDIFERIVQHLVDEKLIKKDEIQRIDATHVMADIAIPSMILMMKKSVYEIFKIIRKENKDIYNKIKKRIYISEYKRETINQNMQGKFDLEKRQKKLVRILSEAKLVLRYVERIDADERLQSKIDLLKQILLENTKKDKKGRYVEMGSKEKPTNRLISPIDPDARCGAKSKNVRFYGYKANITETVKSRFITNVMPLAGNTPDGRMTVKMVEEQEKLRLKPNKIIGDAAYSNGMKRKELLEKGVQLVAPMRINTGRAQHVFPKNMFKYNEKEQTLTCPNNVVSKRNWYDRRHNTITYHFPVYECEVCDLQRKCTNSFDERRTVGITPWHNIMLKTEKYNRTKKFKKEMKMRSPIESVFSEMKRYHGMRRTRYRGIKKVGFQFFVTATVVNIKRWIKVAMHKTKFKKPSTLPSGCG